MLVFRPLLFLGSWIIEINNAGKTNWPFSLLEEKDRPC